MNPQREPREQPSLWDAIAELTQAVKELRESFERNFVRKDVYDADRKLYELQVALLDSEVKALKESKQWSTRNVIVLPLCTVLALVTVAFIVAQVIK